MPQDAESIFNEARSRTGPDRIAYLDAACAGDDPLRARIEMLLKADSEAGAFMDDDPTIEAVRAAQSVGPREQPGQVIGRYKLLELIGQGGFGTVWMAEQREPVKRRVALKIIKLGMDTAQVVARFEAERQALAMMDHANIAKVFDAGSTDTGRPYFVMELVRGEPIIDYCDRARLDTRSRLDLFAEVCRAIQHAHQKGIIHRDIKPSNVLVTLHDGVPVPKVIDFGIAKATNHELTEKTLFTGHRQMIGTPAYMSPEQAEMSGLDIDTRSDIYSLGVLLYELLTGTTPFSNDELLSAGFAEMMRIIRDVEPHKPSTRLDSLGRTATQTADQRAADVRRLNLMLRGDLDWIVMKCLEKDRTRRYETASGLAADIDRHLSDLPVSAGAPGAAYRVRKFVRRNRTGVIGASIAAATLLLGMIGTSIGLVWALGERGRANQQTEIARLELNRATEIKRLITEMLERLDPAEARGADSTLLRAILDDTADRLADDEITDELVAAELRHIVGNTYYLLGLSAESVPHLVAALDIRAERLGDSHPDTLRSRTALAGSHLELGNYDDAETMFLGTLDARRDALGPDHPDTLRSAYNLTLLLWRTGRYNDAMPLAAETHETAQRVLPDDDPERLAFAENLAAGYYATGRHDDAETLYSDTLEESRMILGEDHPQTLSLLNGLAGVYYSTRRFDECSATVLESLEIRARVLGENHPDTLTTKDNLAQLYSRTERFDESARLFEEVAVARRDALGPEHPATLQTATGLARVLRKQLRFDQAELLYTETLAIQRRVLGNEHPNTLICMHELGALYMDQEQYQRAEPLLAEAYAGLRVALGDEHGTTRSTAVRLADTYRALGRPDDADEIER